MASSMVIKVGILAMIMSMILGVITLTQAAPSCGEIQETLSPCIAYVRGSDDKVPGACCDGIKKLHYQAKNTSDRRSVCKCIKNAAQNMEGLNLDKLAGLPKKCGVNLPYPLKPSTDCDKINEFHN